MNMKNFGIMVITVMSCLIIIYFSAGASSYKLWINKSITSCTIGDVIGILCIADIFYISANSGRK